MYCRDSQLSTRAQVWAFALSAYPNRARVACGAGFYETVERTSVRLSDGVRRVCC